jgi:FkbM family methyltransferase
MRRLIKDFEFLFKKTFFSQSYLLKKRLIRAIKKNYEKELEIVGEFTDKYKDAIDIGVYRGVYSYKLSQYFKHVHSFEPNPLLYPYLEKNLTKIIKNISLYNFALSDTNGETHLKLPARSKSIFKDNIEELFKLGAASIHIENKFTDYKKVLVKMKRLDDIKFESKIGFIKIDVEGHEIEVIKGGRETIIKNKPVLLIEIEKRHSNRSVEESINYINKYGYKCFILKNQVLIPAKELEDKKLENNYYFLPENI